MTTPRLEKHPVISGLPRACRWAQIALLSLAAALGGCRDADGIRTYRVSGTVTYDSKPVPVGTIFFHPDFSVGNDGPSGFAQIVDGRYDTAVGRSRNAIAGPHHILIVGRDRPAPGASPEDGGVMLFHDYQTKTDLPQADSRQDYDVPEAARPSRSHRP